MGLLPRWNFKCFAFLVFLVFLTEMFSRLLMIERKPIFHFPPRINIVKHIPSTTQPPEEVKMLKELIAWPEPKGTPSFNSSTSPQNCDYRILKPRANYFVGETLELLLTARDHRKRPKIYGGDFFQAKLHSPRLKAGVTGSVKDHQNGTYTVTFLMLWPGDTEVSIHLIYSSEAIQILKRLRETRPDKVYFLGYFQTTGKQEITECNMCKLNGSLCEFIDPGTGEKWYCMKPKELPCSSWVHHSKGGMRIVTSKEDDDFLDSKMTYQELPGRIPAIHVLAGNSSQGEPRVPLCTPGLPIPNPSGFYYNDVWMSRVCSTKMFPEPSNITKCLSGKVVYMFGDSTLRQWWEYLESFVPSLKRIDLHVPLKTGPLLATDPENNYLIQWRAHGTPLRMDKSMVADLHYMANDIDRIGGGPHTVIVFTIGVHFTFLPVDMYIRRIQIICRAVVALLQRSPQTTVIIKSANTGRKRVDANDWLSLQLDIILRRMFSGLTVAIVDTWQMTSCHYLPDNIHPERIIIQNEIDILLSFICPR
ncbi:NXPE family member 3-like isoform X1 [Microcaecilia unicolor]|uniref:NXPE family member 3-like isoform X1 n=1 Tax=Microcaecilia unicolor TaxID=1415580 RepID=A0A6P7X1X8_9AMPH|nr:NXPE family member 3-like isoform X1 [Microcaecilia unicolor]